MAAFKPPFYFAFSKVLFAVRIIFVEQENSADDDDTNGAEGNATIELTRLLGRRRDFHVGRLGDRKGRSGVRHRGSGNQRRYHQASNKKLQTHIKHPLRERIWTSLPLSLRPCKKIVARATGSSPQTRSMLRLFQTFLESSSGWNLQTPRPEEHTS